MINGKILLSGKRKYFTGAFLLLFIALSCAVFNITDTNDFDSARREILLRRIGHELLLQSGDKTSRVLPVKKIAANEYQISFEHQLTFQPDTLVKITQRLLAKDPHANDYVVNVLERGKPGIAYAYAIAKDKKDDIVTCTGRTQPQAPYLINIKFKPTGVNIPKEGYILGFVPLLAFVGLIFFRSVKPKKVVPDAAQTTMVSVGSFMFDMQHAKLINNGNTINLTGTENRLLRIFAMSPNQTIARSRLQKEIWEDEGVIVGRSLDMFISKLRKKLEVDPNISISVIRGKGYKLEIAA